MRISSKFSICIDYWRYCIVSCSVAMPTYFVFVEDVEDVIDKLRLIAWWEELAVQFGKLFLCHLPVRTVLDEFRIPEMVIRTFIDYNCIFIDPKYM